MSKKVSRKKRKQYSKQNLVNFPFSIEQKNGGNIETYVFNENSVVDCIFCGETIMVNQDTCFTYNHPYDDNVKIGCRFCGKAADASYYCTKRNRTSIIDCWTDYLHQANSQYQANMLLEGM